MRRHRFALLLIPLALAACAAPGPAAVSVPAKLIPSGLLIRMNWGGDDRGLNAHNADYFSDGTVIRWVNGSACENGQPCGTLQRNVLTPAGLATFRDLLAEDADLLAGPMVVESVTAPGTHPLGRGETTAVFVMERPDGTRYMINFPSTTSKDSNTWIPDPAIIRLNALAEVMSDPATLVGASGLADPTWTAYQPIATAVIVTTSASAWPPVFDGPFGPDIEETGWAFGGAPDTFGTIFAPEPSNGLHWSDADSTYRCAFLSSDETVKAISSLPGSTGAGMAKGRLAAGGVWWSGAMRWGDHIDLGMRVVGLLPEDVAGSCSDAFIY
jgi:hypothetical protein